MTTAKYTRSPWIVGIGNIIQTDYRDESGNTTKENYVKGWVKRIAKVYFLQRWISPEEARANANLIAAAPEMYEALKNLENDDGKTMPPSAWKLVQNAIAKAEGK